MNIQSHSFRKAVYIKLKNDRDIDKMPLVTENVTMTLKMCK
jgi:hypothetical protein